MLLSIKNKKATVQWVLNDIKFETKRVITRYTLSITQTNFKKNIIGDITVIKSTMICFINTTNK